MVSIILVSHSKHITLGLKSLINQMCPTVDVISTGGTGENYEQLGTDPIQIYEALEELAHKDTLIFFDIGSSYIASNLALDMSENQGNYYIVDAPLVEGAFLAAVAINSGKALNEVLQELETYKLGKF